MPDILSQQEIDKLLSATDGDTKETVQQKTIAQTKPKKAGLIDQDHVRQLFLIPAKPLEKLQTVPEAKTLLQNEAGDIQAWVPQTILDQLQKIPGAKKIMDEMAIQMEKKMAAEKERAKPIVCSYDFKHPARVNKDQLRTLENLHDNFARLLSSTLSGAMRAVVDVDTAFVDQTTYAEFIMSLSNPSCSYQFTLGPTNGQAIIDVAMPVVFGFVDRAFGGKGASKGVEARQLTPIEIGTINKIIRRVIEDLEATWEPVLRVDISDIELEVNPEFMQITAPSEIVILLAFEVNSAHTSGLVSLCYPFFTLESILPRLSQHNYVRRLRGSREELIRDNRLRLGAMDVPLVAELGRTSLALDQAQNLQIGDIIRLPTRANDPATLFLGGKPKFLAQPFAADNGECKLHIVGRIAPEKQAGYGTVES